MFDALEQVIRAKARKYIDVDASTDQDEVATSISDAIVALLREGR
jgi:hypothetical protein